MPSDDEHEKPPSIASLRSRFESLAASQKGLREVQVSKSRPASPAPDSIKTRAEGYSAGRSDGLAIVGARQDRQGIREPEQLSQGEQDGALRGNNPGGMGNGIGSAQASRPKPPIPPAIPASTASIQVVAPPPISVTGRSITESGPEANFLGDSMSQKAVVEDEEGGLSVKALQDRFGGGSRTTSPVPSRAPSPAPPFCHSRPAPPIHIPDRSQNASTSTLAHMTEREGLSGRLGPDKSSATAGLAAGGLVISRRESGDGSATGLSSSPQPMSLMTGAPAISGTGATELEAVAGAADATARVRKTLPPPVAPRPVKAPATAQAVADPHSQGALAGTAALTTSSAQKEGRRPPPPAPVNRSADKRAHLGSSAEPDSIGSQRYSPLSRASTIRAPPVAPPPALPARKLSLPQDTQLPPPIPGNRPMPSVAIASDAASPSNRPVLPTRPRGDTVAAPPVAAAPSLPTRSDTAPADLPPPPARTAEAGAGLTRRVTRKAVPSDGVARSTSIRQPARRGSVQVPPPPDDGYMAPPPPMRLGGAVVPIPPRQNSKEYSKEADSEEDDPDEPSPALTSNAKRLLEDYPDSTNANRRPPSFVPDIKISGTSHTTAFAAHGRHVCTGTHCVKVYDTLMSDQPLYVVDLKETGLDFRVKENRVTAMCFRPAKNDADEGRYLWCGTKDGHLWELDIKTGDITDTRAFVHSSAVSHIFRYKSWIMSLEESGKLHVFEAQENRRIPQCRTIRVQERFNFAKLIGGRLWTSTGPATRSTTNAAASRGPTIRVYDPCAPGNTLSAGTTVWPSEWTGAVTSATCMPMHPGTVYLGHEGGYVSVWDAEQLQCLQVFKISANDILALEGVGERLWAAGRKGMISVYDVSERPWRTTNVWTAHVEFAIHQLLVDPYSVQDTGRFILWSLAKDGLRAWDGLLSVDWVDQQMAARQVDYCSFREVQALICSWNIDSARPYDLNGTAENQSFFPQLFDSVDQPPEILVFGFQEVIPLTDKKLTAKTLIFGGKDKDSDRISGAYRQWLDKFTSSVREAYPDTPYVKVHSENMVGLLTCAFVKADERDILRDVDVCTVKRGIGGIYGNKGAIVARLVIDDTSICFINVHLAAGQSAKASRTADLAAIMEDKAVFPPSDALPYIRGGDGTAISDHELVILNGDLNYRIDQRRENVVASVSAGDLDYLLEHDQLRKEMRHNHAFRLRSFDEAPIRFEPTYKYNPGTHEYDTSEKNRIPAWCDRILHSKSDRIRSLHYRRYEPTVSDHRPISAAYALKVKAVNWEKMKAVREEVRGDWAKREADVLGRIEKAYADLL